MESITKLAECERSEAMKDLIARLDHALALALDIERQAKSIGVILEEAHSLPLAA